MYHRHRLSTIKLANFERILNTLSFFDFGSSSDSYSIIFRFGSDLLIGDFLILYPLLSWEPFDLVLVDFACPLLEPFTFELILARAGDVVGFLSVILTSLS